MILRLSQKLAQKLKIAPKAVAPPDGDPYADWSAHVFTAARTQYIILTNTPSLYTMLMPGKGITDDSEFIDAAMSRMREFMVGDGMEFIFRKFVVPASGAVVFSKALNRSVTGSMNDFIFQAKYLLVEHDLSPSEVSRQLNEVPMGALRYRHPRDVFKGLRID